MRNVPGTGLYFFILESMKQNIIINNTLVSDLLLGSFSRVAAGQMLMPFTVIKVQMEVRLVKFIFHQTIIFIQSSAFRGQTFRHISTRIFNTEGLKGFLANSFLFYLTLIGFFKGSLATALRDFPGAGIYYMIYQWTKTFFPSQMVR